MHNFKVSDANIWVAYRMTMLRFLFNAEAMYSNKYQTLNKNKTGYDFKILRLIRYNIASCFLVMRVIMVLLLIGISKEYSWLHIDIIEARTITPIN